MRVKWSRFVLGALLCLVVAPAAAFADSAIAGIVSDATGGVLPGVTVEVASPALIEQTRSVVTDAAGAYRIVDLRPGTYKVTFSVIEGEKTLIDKEVVSLTRDLSFDEAQLLAKEREKEILSEALAHDLVALVMRRLAAL